jgi:O-antigen ligase
MAGVAGFALVEMSSTMAFAVALSPLIALAVVYVLTSGQVVLYVGAVVFPMSMLVGEPLMGSLYFQDVIAVFALGAWFFAKFIAPGRVPPIPSTPVLGWPLLLFGSAILSATLRGHYEYGASLIGQPLRLFLYAAIVAGLAGMTVSGMHRVLTVALYAGAVFTALSALYFLATGGTGADQDALSTGGTRILSISVSLYAAAALFLALLNLRLETSPRRRLLHLAIAAAAMFGVVVGFGRAVYLGVAVVGLLFFMTSGRLRRSVLSVVPLSLPFIVVLAIAVNQVAPEFKEAVVGRVSSSPETDANVNWRLEANRAVLSQFREQPLFGVGFGRGTEIYQTVVSRTTGRPTLQRVEIGQDPHNGYVFLLAGGGIVALGSFLLLLGMFALDAIRRYRRTVDERARLIVLWASATLFVFLLNAASGTTLTSPVDLMTIWALLVLPAIVRPYDSGEVKAETDQLRPEPQRVPTEMSTVQ